MLEALAAKNSEIEALVNSMDALKKQAALSEGNLASLQVLHSHFHLSNACFCDTILRHCDSNQMITLMGYWQPK